MFFPRNVVFVSVFAEICVGLSNWKMGMWLPPPAGRPWVATSAAWQCDGSVRHLVWEKASGRILGKSWNWLVNFIDFSRIVLNFHIFPGYFLEFVLISCPWPKMVCSGDVLDPRQLRMEIAIKYFVMTELFVCNFVCRCFFWEESNLAPCRQRKNTASEHFFLPCEGARWYCFYSESYVTWWGKIQVLHGLPHVCEVAFVLQFFVQ